jgi:N-acetylglucosaminyldiphosphoundecaprenol N-acetyl-beta-D-mannosaminyltransferase
MSKITVLGNFSGRNAGDNAILGTLLDDIAAAHPDVHFLVPTLNASFVKKHFGHHNLTALGLMPWNGAVKIFGLPTFQSMLGADVVLVTDNILFDRDFYNPLFNYLSTISFMAPACQKRNIPIVPYNASLGPIRTQTGVKAMQRLMDACPFIILRDKQSKKMLDQNQIRYRAAYEGADCAINAKVPPEAQMSEIIRQEGLFKNSNGTISFNINAYIDTWRKEGQPYGRERFLKTIAGTIDRLIDDLDIDIMYTITQVMDTQITQECLNYVQHRDRVKVVSNATYTYQEITGLLQRADLHTGMRTHSIILSAAALTPMVGINAYPKTVGFMETIGQDSWIINFDDLTVENYASLLKKAWEQRHVTKQNMKPLVEREQAKASGSVALVSKLLQPERSPKQQLIA